LFPFFGVSHLPKSSPVFVNGSLEIQPKKPSKTEKKNGARLSTLSDNGALRKDGASRNFVVQAMARKIKTSVSGPQKTCEKKGWGEMGPKHKPSLFSWVSLR